MPCLSQKPLSVLPDKLKYGRTGGRARSRRLRRAFIPVEAEPFQIVDELGLKARLAALKVGVFNAQNHGATGFTSVEPVHQSGAGRCRHASWPVGEGAKRTRTPEG